MAEIHALLAPIRGDVAAPLERFDAHQLAAIAELLERVTELVHRRAVLLRVEAALASRGSGVGPPPGPGGGHG